MKKYHYAFLIMKFTIFFSLIYIKFTTITKHKYDNVLNKIIHIPTSKEEIILDDMFKFAVSFIMIYIFMPPLNQIISYEIFEPRKQRTITKYDRAIAFTCAILLLCTMNSYKVFIKEMKSFIIKYLPIPYIEHIMSLI